VKWLSKTQVKSGDREHPKQSKRKSTASTHFSRAGTLSSTEASQELWRPRERNVIQHSEKI
jgi:hypothetical protein